MIYQVHQQDAELRGEERGIAIGEERTMVKTATRMLSKKMPVDLISELTDLPINEINKLKAAPSTN